MSSPLKDISILLIEAKPDTALALLTLLQRNGARVSRNQSEAYVKGLINLPQMLVIGNVAPGSPTGILHHLLNRSSSMRFRTLCISTDAHTAAVFRKLETPCIGTTAELIGQLTQMVSQLHAPA